MPIHCSGSQCVIASAVKTNGRRSITADARALVPRLLDQHRLQGRPLGTRTADEHWLEELSVTIFRATPERAADAAAAALAEGFDPSAVGEAIALATNQLMLRDNGRASAEAPNKPAGSIHGDSIGVHACDSANAWRNLARAANPAIAWSVSFWGPGRQPETASNEAAASSPGSRTRARRRA